MPGRALYKTSWHTGGSTAYGVLTSVLSKCSYLITGSEPKLDDHTDASLPFHGPRFMFRLTTSRNGVFLTPGIWMLLIASDFCEAASSKKHCARRPPRSRLYRFLCGVSPRNRVRGFKPTLAPRRRRHLGRGKKRLVCLDMRLGH